MRRDKLIATRFRRQGKSYNWISQKLGVPKSTLSYWFRELTLSGPAKASLYKNGQQKSIAALVSRNKDQTRLAKERSQQISHAAIVEARHLLNNKLFLLGVALYWAEGYKRGATGGKWKCIDFTNADPKMIKTMMRFFREICKVPESSFRAQLIAHQNVQLDTAVKFWSRVTDIPAHQFIQTSVSPKKNSGQRRMKKMNILPMGTLHVRVYDVKLFFRMIGWIEAVKIRFV